MGTCLMWIVAIVVSGAACFMSGFFIAAIGCAVRDNQKVRDLQTQCARQARTIDLLTAAVKDSWATHRRDIEAELIEQKQTGKGDIEVKFKANLPDKYPGYLGQ